MSILKSFSGFANRIIKATEKKISSADSLLLRHLLNRTSERNMILARGLMTAISMNSPRKLDIENVARILDNANIRILKNKEPFTDKEKKLLSKIFSRYGLSPKVADWITLQRDAFLYSQISHMAESKSLGVPTIKKIRKNEEENKKVKTA
ncbi:MAG: hypothetical protein PHU63_00800 [Candidatus ainarchaeum sp.]|nr:hypothetical protein [Candidatus ainarchaeum sp.]